jgi:hypothetical protein
MTLEQRITEALHQADGYSPSIDLFARVSRSIDEDRAHRRRIRTTALGVAVGVMTLGGLLSSVAGRDADGSLGWPKWSIQIVIAVTLTVLLIVLGPAIRRLGKPLLDDVFRLNRGAGERFARLLDIAYYLVFGGGILLRLDLTDLGTLITVRSEPFHDMIIGLASFSAILGVAHATNLLTLPVVGLLYSAIVRRTRRHLAGADAAPTSEAALKADRIVTWMLVVAVLGAIAIGLIVVGIGITGLG